VVGYEETVAELRRRLRPGEIVASESYTWVHTLQLVSGGDLPVYLADVDGGMHGLASLYWYRNDRFEGMDVLWVTTRPRTQEALRRICRDVEVLDPIRVVHDGVLVRRIESYRCRGIDPPEGVMGRLRH
jgi:hypothetical protein